MCPFCMATMGLMAAGTFSAGGLAVLAVKISRKESSATKDFNFNESSSQKVNNND